MPVPNYTSPTTVQGGESGQIATGQKITSTLMQTVVSDEDALASQVSSNTTSISTNTSSVAALQTEIGTVLFGTATGTTDSSGNLAITYPQALPSVPSCIIAVNGDGSAARSVFVEAVYNSNSNTGFFANTSQANFGPIRINWMVHV